MKKYLFIILSLFVSIKSIGQTIPNSRTVDWSKAGYHGNIPSTLSILNVKHFGAAGDGISDDANAIRSAIDSLHGMKGIVYFPPGNFLVGSTIDIPDSTILKGSSNDSTHVIFNFGGTAGNGFNITGSVSGVFTPVISGAERFSNSIVVTDPLGFDAGDYAELIEDNGSWDTQPVSWADNSLGQIVYINKVSGDTLFFDSPLRINYDTSLNVRIQKIFPALEAGIECMRISRQDNVLSGLCINIYFNYAMNCWIQGVESSQSIGSHIEVDASSNISIQGCYIHHSFLYDGVSTHGYGITLFAHTGQCLIQNNIMKNLRHSFSLQTGASGNVIAYNYSLDPNRSESPSNAGADISLHGHFPHSNLFEGNIVQNIQIDQTHGPNGPFNTFFRNRAELYGIIMSSGTVQNDSMNFVGNEVPNTGFLLGNYILAGAGHFEFGNNIKGTITPPGTTQLQDSSYFLSGPPAFWTNSNFPSIGIPNIALSGSIPARDRFLSGTNLTSCNDDFNTGIEQLLSTGFNFFPNPTTGKITIQKPFNKNEFDILIKDLSGKIILKNSFSGSENVFDLPEWMVSGIYLIEIIEAEIKFVQKVVLIK